MDRRMRCFLLALAGAATLGLGALAVEPAQAQGFSISVGSGYGGYHRPYHRPAYRPSYRRYGYYPRPVYYRPYPVYYGRTCFTRVTRVWDGWGWVRQRVRVCR
jgi:hypothetical protein